MRDYLWFACPTVEGCNLAFAVPSAMLALTLLCSCASLKGHPQQVTSPSDLAPLTQYLQPAAIAKFDSPQDSDRNGLTKRQWRDAVIDARIFAADLYFRDFEYSLSSQGVEFGIVADLAVLGINAAGAVATSAANVLSATSAGVVGAKTSVDKNTYYNRTLPALISAMEAQRKQVLVRIRDAEMNKDEKQYPLAMALDDVAAYEAAGSIAGAVTEISTTAGASAARSDQQLEHLVSIGPVSDYVNKRQVALSAVARKLANNGDKVGLDKMADAVGASKDADLKKQRDNIFDQIAGAQTVDKVDQLTTKVRVALPGEGL